jgi:ribosomal protein S18 acetylase RimI-like enzyme
MNQLRHAKIEDLQTILLMIDNAKKKMASLGIDQWQNGSPNESMILQDIHNTEYYVLEDNGRIVAGAMVSKNKEETYDRIDGKWRSESPYVVIHRFVVESSVMGRGFGEILLHKIESMLECKYVRIDTHQDNESMKRLLAKCKYDFCGVISLKDGSKRYAYDKIVEEMKFGGVL